jgi:hypothetical protein
MPSSWKSINFPPTTPSGCSVIGTNFFGSRGLSRSSERREG